MADVGLGVYTLPEAARLIHAEPRLVRRWLKGYRHTHPGVEGQRTTSFSPPLWATQYAGDPDFGVEAIGFLDLLELRVVKSFVDAGVALQVVRRCLERARSMFGTSHPLTSAQFRTDGRTIYLQSLREAESEDLLDLKSSQYAFKAVIKPSLFAGIDYDDDGQARRWFPAEHHSKLIVIDPERQFGKPMLTESAVPTRALYASYKAEGGDKAAAAMVARLFELPVKEVQAAVKFEADLQAA